MVAGRASPTSSGCPTSRTHASLGWTGWPRWMCLAISGLWSPGTLHAAGRGMALASRLSALLLLTRGASASLLSAQGSPASPSPDTSTNSDTSRWVFIDSQQLCRDQSQNHVLSQVQAWMGAGQWPPWAAVSALDPETKAPYSQCPCLTSQDGLLHRR